MQARDWVKLQGQELRHWNLRQNYYVVLTSEVVLGLQQQKLTKGLPALNGGLRALRTF